MFKTKNILTLNKSIYNINQSKFSTSSISNAGKLWRQNVGLPKLQTKNSIVDLPDYSFTDGRPVPLTVGQLKRKQLQERLATEVVEGLSYLNQAKSILIKEKKK